MPLAQNDAEITYLRGKGYVGSLNDMRFAYYQRNPGASIIADMVYLADTGVDLSTRINAAIVYALPDAIAAYLAANGTPGGGGGGTTPTAGKYNATYAATY